MANFLSKILKQKSSILSIIIIIIICACAFLLYKQQNHESFVVNDNKNIEHFDGTGKVFSWHSNPHPGPCNSSCNCYPGSYVRPGSAPCKGC